MTARSQIAPEILTDGLTESLPSEADSEVAPLVFAINRPFVEPLRRALRSLDRVYLEPDPLEVNVLHGGDLHPSDLESLEAALSTSDSTSISFHEVDAFDQDEVAEVNHPAYLRLAIPRIFPDYDRVNYLDADIVFVESPHEFVRLQLGGCAIIAASQDIQNPTLGSGIALPGWDKLGFEAEQPYFNSGVMVMDTSQWSDAQITERAVDFVTNHSEHLRFRDQCALNALLHDRRQSLSLKWNYPPMSAILAVPGARYYAEDVFPLEEVLEGEDDAAIIHYVGPDKPWQDSFPKGRMRDLYYDLTS